MKRRRGQHNLWPADRVEDFNLRRQTCCARYALSKLPDATLNYLSEVNNHTRGSIAFGSKLSNLRVYPTTHRLVILQTNNTKASSVGEVVLIGPKHGLRRHVSLGFS